MQILHDREYLLLIKEEWGKRNITGGLGNAINIYIYYVWFVKKARRKSAIIIEE